MLNDVLLLGANDGAAGSKVLMEDELTGFMRARSASDVAVE
jgi:hypothetical protein